MLHLWRKWIAYLIWWGVLMGGFAILLHYTAQGGETYADMEKFHAQYHASRTADQVQLEVTETIAVELYNERGISRNLITVYGDEEIEYSDIDVTDQRGDPVEFQQSTNYRNEDIELAIGGNVRRSGLETYVISYTMSPAMVGTDRFQELYFNTNGTEWANGFKSFRAQLTVDDDLAQHLTGDEACYQGRAGSTDRCTLVRDGNSWTVSLPEGLDAWENVTIAVGFEPGTVADPVPPFAARSHGWLGIAILVAIGAGALAFALLLRRMVSRTRTGTHGVVTQFSPPKDLYPVNAADFLGHAERGAPAHLTWLVTEGYGRLVDSEADTDGLVVGGVTLHARDRRRLGKELGLVWNPKNGRADEKHGMPHRLRRITQLLFGEEGKLIALGSHRYFSDLRKAQVERDTQLENLDLRHRLGIGPWLLGLGYTAILVYGMVQLWLGLAGLGWWFIGGGVLGILLLLVAVHVLPTHAGLTKHGKETMVHLEGLERFIKASESQRISMLQDPVSAPRDRDGELRIYEELLPWAIVFGEEKAWGQVLGDMYDKFPDVSAPKLPAFALGRGETGIFDDYNTLYRERRHERSSFWSARPDIGEGGFATTMRELGNAISEASAARGDSSSSSRSSGRGWSGGGSSSSGGSRGGGSSGGGTGGGGGGRR
ncbi:DUF2207 family protein [Tessaracoccus terricola]